MPSEDERMMSCEVLDVFPLNGMLAKNQDQKN